MGVKRCRCLTKPLIVTTVLSSFVIFLLMKCLTKERTGTLNKIREEKEKTVNRADLTKYERFEPEVFEDFPTNATGRPLIPHIIHQTYPVINIAEKILSNVISCQRQNPGWEYHLWTDKKARELIAERFPSYLPIWDANNNINRANVIRYFVLYEYGGLYADLDVQCLRPLNKVTSKYAAIFPPEPMEHCLPLHIPFLLGNAIMFSRPKHPFLKQIIDSLANFQPMAQQFDASGPAFVTTQFMIYNKFKAGDAYKLRGEDRTNSPYFYKGEMRQDDIDAVYVPNTHYFMQTLNFRGKGKHFYDKFCATRYNRNDMIVRKGCHEYWLRKSKKRSNKFTFMRHLWQ